MSVAVTAIEAYQRWLSPLKGYRCAHDVLYGRGGCSGFGKRAFSRHSTRLAYGALRRRLQECRAAYLILMASSDEERRRRRAGMAEGAVENACDAADCASGASCDGLDIGSCDI